MPIAVACIAGVVAVVKRRNHTSADVVDPNDIRANQVPVKFWQDRFDAIHTEGDEILRKQDQILKAQNEMLRELAVIKVILTSRVERREPL